jgi:hypothetical protein
VVKFVNTATNGEAGPETISTDVFKEENANEYLYHALREILVYYKDKSCATHIKDVLGTYVSLPAAKAAALTAIEASGYERDDFEIYEEKPRSGENWTHGDGVLLYAKGLSGAEFYIRIDIKQNVGKFKGNAQGRVDDKLYYVIQIKIDCNNDRVGRIQTTEVGGTYLHRQETRDSALTALIDGEGITKEWYEEYDEIDEADPGEWPYGEDCMVHAVSSNGENFLVLVKTQPSLHKKSE